MERYIECKTREQYEIVIEHLNKKYKVSTECRLNYKDDWKDHLQNTIIHDDGSEYWMTQSKSWYLKACITNFTSFEEFCKQEGINMEKKSTNYCFKTCKEFAEYCEDNSCCVSGNASNWYYYNITEDLQQWGWDRRSLNTKRIEITWQEFKQMFIDKTMKTTQQELEELKAKVLELEAKIKEDNESIEISGYKAEFNKKDKTVSFGCKTIKLSQLKAILEVMELNKKFNRLFEITNCEIECEDNFNWLHKETIEKLINKLEE